MNARISRIEWVDIVKGIGIFLVVYGHSRGPLFDVVNFFHMPLFFLLSGFLYKSEGSIKEYILKKINSLYIPYICWNLLGGIGWGLYTGISMSGVCKQSIKILLTLSRGQFFGATWFLGSLFLVTIVYKVLDVCLERTKHKRVIINGMFLGIMLISFQMDLPFMLNRTLILSGFYALGVLIKQVKGQFDASKKHFAAVISIVIFFIIATSQEAYMGDNIYSSKILFLIAAVCGSFFVVYIAQIIQKRENILKKILLYTGKNSMDVVIWHFVFFNFVIILQLLLEAKPVASFIQYSPVYSGEKGWWIVYCIVGVFGSVGFAKLLRKSKLLKKIHVV